MKVVKIGDVQVVMSNPCGKHNYFGWPTACRLQNGKIAVVASGFRLGHVCPFGKMVISYSEDEACTYTAPAPLIDTPLDDRDGGIVAYGESDVIVTSFTNTAAFQRKSTTDPYCLSYIDTITEEEIVEISNKIYNAAAESFDGEYRQTCCSLWGKVSHHRLSSVQLC